MAKRKITSPPQPAAPSLQADQLLAELRQMIEAARSRVAMAANAELTLLYWRIGRRIHSEVLSGKPARYGEAIVATLSRQLVAEYGRSFSAKSLARMVQFAEVFPNIFDEKEVDPTATIRNFRMVRQKDKRGVVVWVSPQRERSQKPVPEAWGS